MVSIPKIIGVVLYHLVLCLSLPIATQADEYKKFDLCAEIPGRQPDPVKCGEKPQQGLHTITGEILHMNGANLLLKTDNFVTSVPRRVLTIPVPGRVNLCSLLCPLYPIARQPQQSVVSHNN